MIKVALLTTDSREHFKNYAHANPYFGTAPEALIEGFKLLPNDVEVHIVSCLQKMPASSPERLAANIYYHGLHVPNIGWMKTGYLGCIRAVRRKLREIQPHIVHGQGTERDCAMSAVFSGLPNVLTIHGNMKLVAEFLRAEPLTFYWFASRLERLCLRKTGGVVAISSYTQTNVSPYTRRAWLIPNAVHPSFFNLTRRPASPPRILCAANIGSRKNQIGLINALDALAAIKPIKLVFVGGGADDDVYNRDFRSMVSDRAWCEYLGPLDRAALQNELQLASVGVLPSFEDNCPMVILEAAAAGLPFSASRVGGIPDLIEHQRTGLLFNPRQPQSICSSVESLIVDRRLADRLAATARAEAVDRFSAESVARQHLAAYNAVVANFSTKDSR